MEENCEELKKKITIRGRPKTERRRKSSASSVKLKRVTENVGAEKAALKQELSLITKDKAKLSEELKSIADFAKQDIGVLERESASLATKLHSVIKNTSKEIQTLAEDKAKLYRELSVVTEQAKKDAEAFTEEKAMFPTSSVKIRYRIGLNRKKFIRGPEYQAEIETLKAEQETLRHKFASAIVEIILSSVPINTSLKPHYGSF